MTHKRQIPPQQGFTLIEALVALLITALGILSILGVQLRTLSDTQTGVRRAQAVRLIEDLSERMRVNVNALDSMADYVSRFGDEPNGSDLSTCMAAGSACDRSSLAKHDLAVWKKSVEDNLPLGKARIFEAAGEASNNKRLLGVVIAWRENERADADEADDNLYREALDTVEPAGGLGSIDGDDNLCSEGTGYICHLQYIPVATRCAPYSSGGGTNKYYCR